MLDIYITYFNNPDFLDRCLNSVSEQQFTKYKIYILDDASKDCPRTIISKWQSKLPIEYTRSAENVGSLIQVQKKYLETSSPYFVWLHHDDFWRENFLQKVFAEGLLKQKSCSFSYALYATETAGHMEETTKHFVPLLLSGPHNPLYHILFSNWIQWSFAIINRKAFDTVGGFDRVVAASSVGTYDPNRLMAFDSYSWARLCLVGKAFGCVERLGVRKLHDDSFGRTNKHRHLEELARFLDQVFLDSDIFDDTARYFSKATLISRIFTKSKIIETIQNTFEESLFSNSQWCDQSVNQRLKAELINIAFKVLDDFYYDDMDFDSRKLLSSSDRAFYSDMLNSLNALSYGGEAEKSPVTSFNSP